MAGYRYVKSVYCLCVGIQARNLRVVEALIFQIDLFQSISVLIRSFIYQKTMLSRISRIFSDYFYAFELFEVSAPHLTNIFLQWLMDRCMINRMRDSLIMKIIIRIILKRLSNRFKTNLKYQSVFIVNNKYISFILIKHPALPFKKFFIKKILHWRRALWNHQQRTTILNLGLTTVFIWAIQFLISVKFWHRIL